ncbi:2,3,4,5-tetrahydropyridine-2,6-dicarboxylate N-succinyltransferase [Candidatus Providencia siddallii]|uniref:2,3,4,5-tetrahydropyridine-2,6-dicarboxylate N-succinyltransferase n=1 Tax=Candidatus Providencia siddallii TaxID=1715285 RepID=A0ABM9NNZ5_9GAMM
MYKLQTIIESAFENKDTIRPNTVSLEIKNAVFDVINLLNIGKLRVAEKINDIWITHQWLKKAILLSFIIQNNKIIKGIESCYFDKIPTKFFNYDQKRFEKECIRVVPQAIARKGSYIGKNTVLMPCYVNIGAYIDEGTMIDTWATIGSCAQIGKNVHISGGVGIGGVLEPLQNNPTIIENDCFIGARSEIVEGVIIEEGSIISMGVFLSKSTKIYNRNTGKIFYGYVPAGSVVVSGNMQSEDKTHGVYCAIIVKNVDKDSRNKININKLLRNIE